MAVREQAGALAAKSAVAMPCRVDAVGTTARAIAATAVSRRVDEDLSTRGGVAGPDPLRPDRRDEIDELGDRDRREAFVEPASWPQRKCDGPAANRPLDERCAGADLRDDRVEAGDEVAGARRGQDVDQPFAQRPASLEVVPSGRR